MSYFVEFDTLLTDFHFILCYFYCFFLFVSSKCKKEEAINIYVAQREKEQNTRLYIESKSEHFPHNVSFEVL